MDDFIETKNESKLEVEFQMSKAIPINGVKMIALLELFAILTEARAKAIQLGWETAVLDPIEEELRRILR